MRNKAEKSLERQNSPSLSFPAPQRLRYRNICPCFLIFPTDYFGESFPGRTDWRGCLSLLAYRHLQHSFLSGRIARLVAIIAVYFDETESLEVRRGVERLGNHFKEQKTSTENHLPLFWSSRFLKSVKAPGAVGRSLDHFQPHPPGSIPGLQPSMDPSLDPKPLLSKRTVISFFTFIFNS